MKGRGVDPDSKQHMGHLHELQSSSPLLQFLIRKPGFPPRENPTFYMDNLRLAASHGNFPASYITSLHLKLHLFTKHPFGCVETWESFLEEFIHLKELVCYGCGVPANMLDLLYAIVVNPYAHCEDSEDEAVQRAEDFERRRGFYLGDTRTPDLRSLRLLGDCVIRGKDMRAAAKQIAARKEFQAPLNLLQLTILVREEGNRKLPKVNKAKELVKWEREYADELAIMKAAVGALVYTFQVNN